MSLSRLSPPAPCLDQLLCVETLEEICWNIYRLAVHLACTSVCDPSIHHRHHRVRRSHGSFVEVARYRWGILSTDQQLHAQQSIHVCIIGRLVPPLNAWDQVQRWLSMRCLFLHCLWDHATPACFEHNWDAQVQKRWESLINEQVIFAVLGAWLRTLVRQSLKFQN